MGKGKVTYTNYNNQEFERKEITHVGEINIIKDDRVHWLDITSLEDRKVIKEIGEKFRLHSLVIEDILNIEQRPKVEEYDDYLFVIIEKINFNRQEELQTEQISLVLFQDLVISFRESDSPLDDDILVRLKEGTNLRHNGADDLLYTITDVVVDQYFEILELIGDQIDDIEDELLFNPTKEILQKTYKLKRDLIYIRKTLWAMRNAMSSLSKNDYELIDERTMYYFRDVDDHISQMIDINETLREICSGILEIYLSSIGNKTNDIMKVLTIFSTIFSPLAFLAGVYGMNFIYFPEIHWKYGYLGFWMMSLGIIGLMMIYFKRKKWL